MRRNPLLISIPVCAVILIAGSWITKAGDLNPPPGPIAPTGVTLADLQTEIQSLAAQGSCCNRPIGGYWKVIPSAFAAIGTDIVTESGVLHRVQSTAPNNFSVQLSDVNGEVFTFKANLSSEFVEVNLRFEGRLRVTTPGSTGTGTPFQIIYSIDSDY